MVKVDSYSIDILKSSNNIEDTGTTNSGTKNDLINQLTALCNIHQAVENQHLFLEECLKK